MQISVRDGTWRLDREAETLYLEHEVDAPGFLHSLVLAVPSKRPWLPKELQLGAQDWMLLGAVAALVLAAVFMNDRVVTQALRGRFQVN